MKTNFAVSPQSSVYTTQTGDSVADPMESCASHTLSLLWMQEKGRRTWLTSSRQWQTLTAKALCRPHHEVSQLVRVHARTCTDDTV